MAISSPSTILSGYQELLAELSRQRKGLAGKQAAQMGREYEGETFAESLGERIARRETAPEISRREQEAVKGMFESPSKIREQMGGVVSPLEREKAISGAMSGWLDQLNMYKDMRERHSEKISDIVKSTARGYEAEVTKYGMELSLEESKFEALKDQADRSWDLYKESQRQVEWRANQARLRSNSAIAKLKKSDVKSKLMDYFSKLDKKYAGEDLTELGELVKKFGVLPVEDDERIWQLKKQAEELRKEPGFGERSAGDWLAGREVWFGLLDTYKEYEDHFSLRQYVDLENPENVAELRKAGIEEISIIDQLSDRELLSETQSSLNKCNTVDQVKQVKMKLSATGLGDEKEYKNRFLAKLIEISGNTVGREQYNELFPEESDY